MTAGEIVTRYRQAKDKKGQIKILSQLNACPSEEIKQVLVENGVEMSDLPVLRKKWTVQEEDRLRQLAAEGLTCEQIGKEVKRTEKAVREKAERMHVSIRQPDEEMAVLRETMILRRGKEEEVMQAMFDNAMAQETGTSITVPANSPDLPLAATSKEKREQKSWTPEEGMPLPPAGGKAASLPAANVAAKTHREQRSWTEEEERLMLELVAEGRDHQEIGEALHRSTGSIKHKLKHIRAVGLKAKAGKFQPPAETSRRLSVAEFNGMVTAAIGQELHAGAEARLVDMLSALGYMVMKYFAGGQEQGHE